MKKQSEQNYQLAMEISSGFNRFQSEYATISIRFCKWNDDNKIDYFYSHDDEGKEMDGLCVNAQMDDHNPSPYGYRIAFRDKEVELHTAERMLKTLKHISKGMAKMEDKLGYCQDYPDYVIRIANVLNVKKFVFRKSGLPDYIAHDIPTAKYRITDLVGQLLNQLQPELKKAA